MKYIITIIEIFRSILHFAKTNTPKYTSQRSNIFYFFITSCFNIYFSSMVILYPLYIYCATICPFEICAYFVSQMSKLRVCYIISSFIILYKSLEPQDGGYTKIHVFVLCLYINIFLKINTNYRPILTKKNKKKLLFAPRKTRNHVNTKSLTKILVFSCYYVVSNIISVYSVSLYEKFKPKVKMKFEYTSIYYYYKILKQNEEKCIHLMSKLNNYTFPTCSCQIAQ